MPRTWLWIFPCHPNGRQLRPHTSEPDEETPAGAPAPDDCAVSALQLQLAAEQQERSKALQELDGVHHEYAEVKRALAKGRNNEDALSRALAAEEHQKHETQRRLVTLQNELERSTVLLKKEQQEKADVTKDRDRYRDQINRRLLTQGTDIQAAFPTTFEIRARIERVAIEAASDWLEAGEAANHQLHPGISQGRVLAGLFFQCQALVEQQHQHHIDFFLGGAAAAVAGFGRPMRQDTADFMLKHMRRHYMTLFPLTGVELDHAFLKVDAMLRRWVAQTQAAPALRPQSAAPPSPDMCKTIREYLHVLVTATLQNPPVVFSDDCGMEQSFDSKVHSQPIDGDAIGNGERCIVVFPCLMLEADNGSGARPLTKRFILPAGGSS